MQDLGASATETTKAMRVINDVIRSSDDALTDFIEGEEEAEIKSLKFEKAILSQVEAWEKQEAAIRKANAEADAFFNSVADLGVKTTAELEEEISKNNETLEEAERRYKNLEISMRDLERIQTKVAENNADLSKRLEGTSDSLDTAATKTDDYSESLEGSTRAAVGFDTAQRTIQGSLQRTIQALVETGRQFDQLAAAQGRAAAIQAGVAGGGTLVQGGRVLELAGGGSRLTSTPGLSGGLSERGKSRTGNYSNLS
jgi:chromosome segregation ATPase